MAMAFHSPFVKCQMLKIWDRKVPTPPIHTRGTLHTAHYSTEHRRHSPLIAPPPLCSSSCRRAGSPARPETSAEPQAQRGLLRLSLALSLSRLWHSWLLRGGCCRVALSLSRLSHSSRPPLSPPTIAHHPGTVGAWLKRTPTPRIKKKKKKWGWLAPTSGSQNGDL